MSNEEGLEATAVGPDNQLAAGSTVTLENCSESSQTPAVRRDNQLAAGSTVILENCSEASQTPAVRPDYQLPTGSSVIPENCSGSAQTPAVRSDNQLAAESTVIQENCFGSSDTPAAIPANQLGATMNATAGQSTSKGNKNFEKHKKRSLLSILSKIVSKSPETSRLSITEDAVSITDCHGRVLEPGDAVSTGMFYTHTSVIYIGDHHVVFCKWWSNKHVVKKRLDLEQSFEKLKVISGQCRVFPPEERVRRATSQIGTKFSEKGLLYGRDFPYWVYTGMGVYEAAMRGFQWNSFKSD